METTEDKLLNGRITLFQPKKGYRVALDPVLLAAAIPAKEGDRILDLGVGTGAVSLCLQARIPKTEIKGIDTNTRFLELAQKSVTRNDFDKYIDLHFGDVRKPPKVLMAHSFDWVVANPPYFSADSYSKSPHKDKSDAHATDSDICDWVDCAADYVKPNGGFMLIYHADGDKTLRNLLKTRFSELKSCQILPKHGQKAIRTIFMAKNSIEMAEIELEPIVLQGEDGKYTDKAHEILWDMQHIAMC